MSANEVLAGILAVAAGYMFSKAFRTISKMLREAEDTK